MKDRSIVWVAHADNSSLVRSAARRLIEGEEHMRLVGSYSDAESAIFALQTHHADVLVMDLSMPGMGGLLAIKRLREVSPRVRVVVLSSHDLDPHGDAALRAGASVYLQKPAGASELTTAIRKAALER